MRRRNGLLCTRSAAIALLICAPIFTLAQGLPANSATLPVAAETDPAVTTEVVAGHDSASVDTGTVVFFRGIRMQGAAWGYTIYDGDTRLGKLTNGTYFVVRLPAGEHRLVVNSWAQYPQYPQYLSVEPGQTYYVFGNASDRLFLSEAPREMFEGMKPILKDVTVEPQE